MNKRHLLLNLSLIFGVLYHVLYLVMYLLQKPIFGRLSQIPDYTLEQLKPFFSLPVLIAVPLSAVVFIVFVSLLMKNTSRDMFVIAIVFSSAAFVIHRIVNFFGSANVVRINKANIMGGEMGIVAYGLNNTAVQTVDLFLLPLYVAAITLMCCAACVKE